MRQVQTLTTHFLRSEDGPTAVEYALLLALILVLCIAAVGVLGSHTGGSFNRVGRAFNTTLFGS